MTISIATAVRNNMMTQIKNALEAGTTNTHPRLLLYTSPRPAAGGAGTTLLAAIDLDQTITVGATDGVLSFGDPSPGAGSANGTAAWARLVDKDENYVIDLDVATSGSDVNLTSLTVINGGTIDMELSTLTEGNP